MEKFCQSCGMPLKGNQGTEQDGSLSEKYCQLCYKDGTFVEPNITMKEMLERGKNGIDQGDGNPISKMMLKFFYPMQLKNLERWK